jgi:SAM-dependent methyltransferase
MRRPAEQASDDETFDEDYYARAYGGSRGSYHERTTPNKWRSMCRFIREVHPEPRVAIDVGCADGAFLKQARGDFPGTEWRGCEISRYAIQRARTNLPGMDLREGSVTRLPWDDGACDLIVAFDVLEHVADLPAAAAEIARVLTPGGTLVMTVPVYDGPVGWLVRLLDKDPTHVHKVARRFWVESPLDGRFELVRWEGLWRYYLARYWHLRARALRSASPAIVVAWRRR